MRDHDDCQFVAFLSNLVNRLLHLDLALGVQGRCRFVEDQDLRALDQSSCYGDSLLLST